MNTNTEYYELPEELSIERIYRDREYIMYKEHFHNEYEIYYLLRGERRYIIGKNMYTVKKGSLVFIDRNQIHRTDKVDDPVHERILILFNEYKIKPFFELSGVNISDFYESNFGVVELDTAGQQFVEHLLFTMLDEMKHKARGYDSLVRMKLMELLLYVIRLKPANSLSQPAVIRSAKHKQVSEVVDYIYEEYRRPLSLEGLSKQFYTSKSYLSRIFKEVTGYTVNEYINVRRIKQAKLLLETSDMNITELTAATGYDSITYFEKVFRKYTGISPLKYRKNFITSDTREMETHA